MGAKLLFLESFYGGSHRDFADGFIENSRHRVELITLPGRFWKWRLRTAAFTLYQSVADPRSYDAVITTDLVNLAELAALWPEPRPPVILYMHENQISYPTPQGERPEYSFGFSNIVSALIADRIIFNSYFHMYAFLDALPAFIAQCPEFAPHWVVEQIRHKCLVLYPGCRFLPVDSVDSDDDKPRRPLVVWNHRWEFDKNPDSFFGALGELDAKGVPFDLALMGECSQKVPKPFIAARERYGPRVRVYGYLDSREEYYRWLTKGTVVISTAIQENFGISVVEAIRMGCFPLLPARLSYPEVLPKHFHELCLYTSQRDLVSRLKTALTRPLPGIAEDLPEAMERYSWKNLINRYDDLVEEVVDLLRSGST